MQPGPRGGISHWLREQCAKGRVFFCVFLNIIIVLLLQSSLSASQNPREKIFFFFFAFIFFQMKHEERKQRKVCHCDFKGGDNRLYFSE